MTSMTTSEPHINFQHTTSLVDELNRHWRDGGPSDQLSAAGVLVHILDGKGIDHVSGFANTTDGLPPPPQILWESFGRPNRALPYGDRMSASLLSRHTPMRRSASLARCATCSRGCRCSATIGTRRRRRFRCSSPTTAELTPRLRYFVNFPPSKPPTLYLATVDHTGYPKRRPVSQPRPPFSSTSHVVR